MAVFSTLLLINIDFIYLLPYVYNFNFNKISVKYMSIENNLKIVWY